MKRRFVGCGVLVPDRKCGVKLPVPFPERKATMAPRPRLPRSRAISRRLASITYVIFDEEFQGILRKLRPKVGPCPDAPSRYVPI